MTCSLEHDGRLFQVAICLPASPRVYLTLLGTLGVTPESIFWVKSLRFTPFVGISFNLDQKRESRSGLQPCKLELGVVSSLCLGTNLC